MVERGGLENRCRGNPLTEGSNPSPSAILSACEPWPSESVAGLASFLTTLRRKWTSRVRTVPVAPAEHTSSRPATKVRPEIQALRAIAVLLVVIYHFWPSALPGGFVGVDVFFVISGFLITSHLLREVQHSGRISLPAFWARRARRILPAAFFVLVLCAVATIAFVPETYWQQSLTELRASTLYVQNWQLAASAVDYLAAQNDPTLVQHFWSLSAEEQFYLVWPVLILLAALLARGRGTAVRVKWIAVTLFTVTALSLAYSIYYTEANPAAAYFVTPTRAWEFGAGGLLALLPSLGRPRAALSRAVSWAGIAAIVVTAFTYSVGTPFPGYQALLPILGALAVIWAGAPALRWAPTPAMKLAPVQFVGDISYSVYLWHWPLLVLAPFVTGQPRDLPVSIVLLALTFLAAWLTKILVEDPVRIGPILSGRPARWTFASVLAASLLVAAFTAGGDSYLRAQIQEDEQVSARVLAKKPRCFGAASRDALHPCKNPKLRLAVVPSPIAARDRHNSRCTRVQTRPLRMCAFGARPGKNTPTLALIGDSHGSHWRGALDIVARARRWRGLSMTRTGCYYTGAIQVLLEPARTRCLRWKQELLRWFPKHPEVSTVVVSQASGGRGVEGPSGQDKFDAQVAGFIKGWKALPASVKHIIVIRDNPKIVEHTLGCVQRALDARRRADRACAEPRRTALDADAAAAAARRLRSPRVQVIDLTRFMCGARQCYPVVGGVLVYKNQTHLTDVFVTSLGPYMLRQVDTLMRSG